jgi:hypothetical protein
VCAGDAECGEAARPGCKHLRYARTVLAEDQYRMTFKFDMGNATDVLVSDTH